MDADILRRVQRLEDREAIRELLATYCFLVDDRRFDELIDTCFTDDATCDFRGTNGATQPMVSSGRDEVRNFFTQIVGELLDDMCHTVHNARIIVDGDTASGECYFELTAIHRPDREALVGAGRYVDRYRRVDGVWRFTQRNALLFHMAPLAEGWSKRRFFGSLTGG